ncbi:MAG: hypothetical protein ABR579_04475 [Actinomycetota bacterium]
MKIRLAATTAAMCLIVAGPASAGHVSNNPRVIGYAYTCSPCGVSFGPTGGMPMGGVSFWPTGHEHYASVRLVDQSGRPVAFEVWQGAPGNDRYVGRGCGTHGPFLIEAGIDISVIPMSGVCDVGAQPASLPTKGMAYVTFTR